MKMSQGPIYLQRARVLAALDNWCIALDEGTWTRPHLWVMIRELRKFDEMRFKGQSWRRVELDED